MKKRRRTKTKTMRPSAPKVVRSRRSSVGSKDKKIALLTRERDEALEQQAATSEVLRVIRSSPGELEPVFQAMLENATRICEAKFGILYRIEGNTFYLAAQVGTPSAYAEFQRRRGPFQPQPGNQLERVLRTKELSQTADYAAEPAPGPAVTLGGARSTVCVPLLKDDVLVGAITIYRQEVRPFTDKQIDLVQNFAAQAVIAIENTRLLNELRQSLEQQTATSDVLQVISSSPGELKPVFAAILENGTRICQANFGTLYLVEGDGYRTAAMHNAPLAFVEARRHDPMVRATGNTPLARIADSKRPIQVVDVAGDSAYQVDAQRRNFVALTGARSTVYVPMLKEDVLIGVITIFRQEVRPFADRQVELLESFASQAVIAIENARLLNELRERTDDLTESLEQQTATSEVLSVISSSLGELEPVFRALLGNATRLCQSQFGGLFLSAADGLRNVATHGGTTAIFEYLRQAPLTVPSEHPHVPLVVATRAKRVVHVTDVFAERSYIERDPIMVRLIDNAGARTVLVVPMLKEDELIGAIAVFRLEVQAFTDKQIALLQNFAAQAVIAIENTRLLNELRQRTDDLTESLEQQTATADVLRIISSSPGALQPVFQSVLENATRICEAKFGALTLRDGNDFRRAALHNAPPALVEENQRNSVLRPHPSSGLGRLLATKRVVQIDDLRINEAYLEGVPSSTALVDTAGARTALFVPMLREGDLVGSITIYRQEVRPFTDKQVELLTNFAAQAVIAIENTRLLNELRQRTDDLTESLEQQTATTEVLKVISASPGELPPVFQAMLENAVRVCNAKFGLMYRYSNNLFQPMAWIGIPPMLIEYLQRRGAFEAPPGTGLDRVLRTKAAFRAADDLAGESPGAPARLGGARSTLLVPMFRESELVGVIAIYRQEVRPFTDKQVELLTNFAAQAVIAIDNTRLLNELRQRTTDLTESLEQQTATSEVLKVISSSPGELEPVFQAMLENATRICEAKFGTLFLSEGDAFRVGALHNAPPALAEFFQRGPIRPGPHLPLGQVAKTKQVSHIADVTLTEAYIDGDPLAVAGATLGGYRTVLTVPMLKEAELVGVIVILRQEVRPFTDKQIALVQNFAAQAVIAIENTRLLNELRESLERQTATSDVLSAISKSPGDLEQVFQSILENATRLCEARFGNIFQFDGNAFHFAARVGTPRELAEFQRRRGPFLPVEGGSMDRMMRNKQVIHVVDNSAEAVPTPAARLGGARSTVDVPMIKDGALVGSIAIYRQEVRPFTDKQIALVQNFASQAVIAIENARLLNELRESLQQQTATSEVLRVISSLPGQLQPVFETVLADAAKLCAAAYGAMWLCDGDGFRAAAVYGDLPPAFQEQRRSGAVFYPSPTAPLGQVAASRRPVQVDDFRLDQSYIDRDPLPVATVEIAGVRTLLSVPMVKDDALIGAIAIYRKEVRPFTDKQIALVQNFAAQAVIAIENTRLLNELRQRTDDLSESLEQQTATSEVLSVISSSPGEVEPVFESMLENAVRLCDARFGIIYSWDGALHLVSTYNAPPEFVAARSRPWRPSPDMPMGRMIATKTVTHVVDMAAEQGYIGRNPMLVQSVEIGGARSYLAVPMLKDDEIIGAIGIFRQEVRPFTDKQIALVRNFAAQAVIAIENTRLLKELRQRTTDLSKSLEDLRTAQDRLVQTEKLASLGQLTAGIAHEIKNPLNFVNNFSAVSVELIDELREALGSVHLDSKVRTEISEIADTLQGNLDKIVQHGKRADAIVKNMLLHSRQGSGEHRPVDINALVEESLNLAYHGARAEKQGFNITLERSFDPAAGEADVFPQEITRALLNLISNGFYAATKRKAEANGGNYEPTLIAATRNLGDRVEITIRDNGTGIPAEVKEKMFNPFFTTKPAGEGTGLGLSISHDIIVKQHGGSIEVDSRPGEFTEFRIVLPRAGGVPQQVG